MKKILITLAMLLLAAPAFAQHGGTGPTAGGYDGGAVDNPFLAPDGSAGAPSLAFTNSLDTGMYLHTADETIGFSVDASLLFDLDDNGSIARWNLYNQYATQGVAVRGYGGATSNYLAVFNPALGSGTGPIKLFADATNNYLYVDGQGTNSQTSIYLETGDTALAPRIQWVANATLPDSATTLSLTGPAAPSGGPHTITLQNATGTVAFLSDVGSGGPTRVSQAANLVTSEVYTSAVATNLLFAPANSTEYYIQGKVFVASDTVAYGVGFQFTFPTTDAIAGSCTADIPSVTTTGETKTAPAASGATTSQISGATTVSPAGTVVVYTINCYLSTTTTTSGNFAVLFGGENAGGSYTLYAGSYIDYEALP